MPIAQYGVLRGHALKRQDATKHSQHYQVLIDAGATSKTADKHRIAVNVQSTVAPHEVLYLIDQDYQHAILASLSDLAVGFTAIESAAGGLALDYVRGHLFETPRMRPIPAEAGASNDMNKVLDGVIARAIDEEESASVFAFGQFFPPEGQEEGADKTFHFSPGQGIHDIHMNQGNEKGHQKEDGAWQDGALLVHFTAADRWVGVFIAFQSQSFKTDASGHAIGASTAPRARDHRRDRKKHPMAPLGISLSPMEVTTTPSREPGERFVTTDIPEPTRRPLRAYAFDPSRGRLLGNEMRLDVRYRKLAAGPVEIDGDVANRIAVVDYDGTTQRFYRPVDLDDTRILLEEGLQPSESDPRFHQQMVYAVASETIEHFEAALGRRIHWRRAERTRSTPRGWQSGDILALNLYPHAMRAPNAYYSPDAHGILFGYFAADRDNTVRSLPNQPVFTCLSHDVIVHEMTHAVIDGQRGHFIEQTNRDVAAFHEGFADLAALFRHFSHREVLLDTLQRTGGRLYNYQLRPNAVSDGGAAPSDLEKGGSVAMLAEQIAQSNPLIELAQQFGDATGLRRALRSGLGTPPTPAAYKSVTEPHARGSILVAAVFDAFFSIYIKRTSDLFAIFRAGGGRDNPTDLPGPLANLLCNVATQTANEFFNKCVRAIDYCPPVDITFGEFLRAMITAEVDRDPEDAEGIREALMQAFRLRGIYPDGARFFSEDALTWTRGADLALPCIAGLHFGDPNTPTREDNDRIAPILHGYLDDPTVRDRLGLDRDLPLDIPSFHPVFRAHANGGLQRDMVVEVVQTRQVDFDHDSGTSYPFRAGATLLIEPAHATNAHVRWVVTKPMLKTKGSGGSEAHERHLRQQAYLAHQGLTGNLHANALHVNFALVHGGV